MSIDLRSISLRGYPALPAAHVWGCYWRMSPTWTRTTLERCRCPAEPPSVR